MWYRIDAETGEMTEVTGDFLAELIRTNFRGSDGLVERMKTFGTVVRTTFADYFWQRVPIPKE